MPKKSGSFHIVSMQIANYKYSNLTRLLGHAVFHFQYTYIPEILQTSKYNYFLLGKKEKYSRYASLSSNCTNPTELNPLLDFKFSYEKEAVRKAVKKNF